MKKLLTSLILLLIFCQAYGVEIGLRFDRYGNFINPDDYLVMTALEADKNGYKNDARWRLMDAAEFGNKHAQHFIGLHFLQEEDYINGLAWLKLAGIDSADNNNLISTLEQQLSHSDLKLSKEKLDELKQKYNFYTALERRAQWKKSLSFGGTRIKGHVPIGLKTYLPSGQIIYGNELKTSLNDFVFEYRYNQGEVILKDFKTIDSSADLPKEQDVK